VNQAHLAKAGLLTLFEVFFDNARDILGLKWVEIYRVTQRDLYRFAEWRIRLGAKRIATLVFAALTHKIKEGKKRILALPLGKFDFAQLALVPPLVAG
jgi:hypothetical protein